MKTQTSQKGFTLIELLVVIAIVVALGVTVFAALNPVQRLRDARDAQRITAVDQILTAIHTHIIDTKLYPTGLTEGMLETQLGSGNAAACSPLATGGCNVLASTACVNLTTPLANYLASMPFDPNGTATVTGYTVVVDGNGLVTIKACAAEGGTNISVSR